MKRQNLRTVSLIVVTFTYLLIGAAIFGYLESEHEMRQREQVDWMEKRVRWKYNISEDDYTVLTTAIIKSVPHKAGIQWKFPGAFYFATTVVTTIGYGHSTPSTLAGRSFCMVYALIGIPLGLVMFQSIGERLNTIVRVGLRHVKRCLRTKNPEVTQTNLVMVVLVLSTILMTSMAAIFAKYERWEYFDALYYCFITLTTIGFGDYVALQKESALQAKPEYVILSLVFILFGLSVVSSAVNLLVLKFLTLNTEDERRDEQIRSTAALDPYELKGVEITMNATKQQLAAARAKLQANERTKAGRLPSGSSSDNEHDDDDDDEQPDENEHEDEAGRLVLRKRAGLRALSQTYGDKHDGHTSELDEPDLKYCDPDGFHESVRDRMQLHQRAHNWCNFCHELDEPAPSMHPVDLLAGRGQCCFRHELPVCQVVHSNSYQLGACRLQQPDSGSRRRPAASRSQHSFPVQCHEQKPSPTNQRARLVTSADDEASTTSSKKLTPLDLGGSTSRMASSSERWHDQLAGADLAHRMSDACNHCDRHSNYLRQRTKPGAPANVMGANVYRQQYQYYYDGLQRNQANLGPRCSLSSVRIRPLSDSNDDSNQSMARGVLKVGVSSRRSPAVARPQQRHHSNSCSCSNDSLDHRRFNSQTGCHLRAIEQPLALDGALPTCSSPHLLLNAGRLQEQQLVDNRQLDTRSDWNRASPPELESGQVNESSADAYDIDDQSLALVGSAETNHRTSEASVARQHRRQSSWIGVTDIKSDKLHSSALSLGANQLSGRDTSTFRSFEGSRGEKAGVLQNRSANELERKAPGAVGRQAQVSKLLCKCCCEHDECVRYALKQAASSQSNMVDKSPTGTSDAENRNGQQRQAASSTTNEESSTVTDVS